jgi:hypothetical protein
MNYPSVGPLDIKTPPENPVINIFHPFYHREGKVSKIPSDLSG